MTASDGEAGALVGRVLCHDVHDGAGQVVLRKGTLLDTAAAARLVALRVSEAHVLELEPGDVHEDAAGERLAAAAAGPGVRVRDADAGQWALVAAGRGLLRVRVGALGDLNALEGIAVYTLYDAQVVDEGEVVARAKVTPLALAGVTLAEAERRARREDGLVTVVAFRPARVAAVAPASLPARARQRFQATLEEKLCWFGAALVHAVFVEPRAEALAEAFATCLARGAEMVVAAGANALDPLDPMFDGLARAGARLVRRGLPAHPGSLLWLAELGSATVIGMPSCGMFSQATAFDLVLPRLLAGEVMGPTALAAFGHGGLLGRASGFRFPPYRAGQPRGALSD